MFDVQGTEDGRLRVEAGLRGAIVSRHRLSSVVRRLSLDLPAKYCASRGHEIEKQQRRQDGGFPRQRFTPVGCRRDGELPPLHRREAL